MKYIIKLLLLSLSASFISCYAPHSTDPIGDGFTRAGDAIGKVVNSFTPPAHTTSSPAPYYPTTNE